MYARERYCPDVTRTRNRLSELGLAWAEHDIEAEADAATTIEKLTGMRRVPTVIIGENVLVEPLNDELDAALRAVGYDLDALECTASTSGPAGKDGLE